MSFLGVELDVERNRRNESVLSTAASRVRVMRIETDEETFLARAAVRHDDDDDDDERKNKVKSKL